MKMASFEDFERFCRSRSLCDAPGLYALQFRQPYVKVGRAQDLLQRLRSYQHQRRAAPFSVLCVSRQTPNNLILAETTLLRILELQGLASDGEEWLRVRSGRVPGEVVRAMLMVHSFFNSNTRLAHDVFAGEEIARAVAVLPPLPVVNRSARRLGIHDPSARDWLAAGISGILGTPSQEVDESPTPTEVESTLPDTLLDTPGSVEARSPLEGLSSFKQVLADIGETPVAETQVDSTPSPSPVLRHQMQRAEAGSLTGPRSFRRSLADSHDRSPLVRSRSPARRARPPRRRWPQGVLSPSRRRPPRRR